MEIWKESNEIQDLLGRAIGFSESKELKSWCEVSKEPLNVWHEVGHLEIIYSKLPEVRECRKVTQGAFVKHFWSELDIVIQA